MELLVVSIALLRLLIPSIALSLLLCQGVSVATKRLFGYLQASSFLEDGQPPSNGYTQIPSHGNGNRASVVLPPDEHGILPVVVPVRTLRRGLIFAVFALCALSYLAADGAILIAHSLVSQTWESGSPPSAPGDHVPSRGAAFGAFGAASIWAYEEFYIFGTSLALVGQTLVMAWQERKRGLARFRPLAPAAMLLVTLVGEVALLATLGRKLQLDARRPHTWSALWSATDQSSQSPFIVTRVDGWVIAHLASQSARVLLLLLGTLAFTPLFKRTQYLPNEYRSLVPDAASTGLVEGGLVGGRNAAGNGSSNSGGYGTFANGSGTGTGHASPRKPGTPAALALSNQLNPEPQLSFWSRIKVLAPHLWPRKSRTLQVVALVCFLLLGVGRVVNLFVPRTLGQLIEKLSTGQSPWPSLLLYCGLRFLQGSGGVVTVISNNLWVPVAQYSEREMSAMTFQHLLNLSLSFQVKKKTGEVLRTLDRASAINSFFNVLLFQLVPIAVDIVVAVIYLWATFGLLLAVLVAVVMVIYVAASVVLTRLRVTLRRDMNEKDKYTRGILADTLANWDTVKFFTAEQREQARYGAAIKEYQRSEYRVIASLNALNLIQNGVISLGLVAGSCIVAFSVVQGQRSVGDFVLFTSYLQQLYGPLNILGTLYRVIQTNLVDTDNLMKLLAEETEITDKAGAHVLCDARGEIELDHVNFTYDGKVDALKNLTVKIPAGTSVALVGESGSGKSTLFRLLYRFYEVTGGAIRFDGSDIRDVTQTSLRQAIGVVPQEAVLFNDTIAYNIGYGKDNATQAEIEEAAKAARIYDRIEAFPDGWDTKVGERGVRLSGGEKQRVSIARAILKNPAILLLDEATSALDTQTEREIQSSLRKLAEGRTSIAIAHRLSTVTYCDLILVLKDGEIAEQGDHKSLIARKGLYYNLWQKQIRAEEEADVGPAQKVISAELPQDAGRVVPHTK